MDQLNVRLQTELNRRKKGGMKPKTHHFFKFIVWVAGWIAPPVAILIRFGIGKDFFINIICTLCGYFPGHFHNFYCQTIRNNRKASRTPKWAIKYGLVEVKDKRGGKHQWAGRYDERLPDSSRYGYGDNEDESPNASATWDGRGPEPSGQGKDQSSGGGRKHHFSLSPWDREVDPEEVEGGPRYQDDEPPSNGNFDPIENEQFYSTNTHDNGVAKAQGKKKKGFKGILSHRDRYESSSTDGDRFERMKAARGANPQMPARRVEDEYQDEFERELNTGSKYAQRSNSLRPQQTGQSARGASPQMSAGRVEDEYQDEFERELNTGSKYPQRSNSLRPQQTGQSARYDSFDVEGGPEEAWASVGRNNSSSGVKSHTTGSGRLQSQPTGGWGSSTASASRITSQSTGSGRYETPKPLAPTKTGGTVQGTKEDDDLFNHTF